MADPLDLTRAARERRQQVWQAGYDHAARLDKAGHFAPPADHDAYEQYLYMIGISNYLTAQARERGHLDAPVSGPVQALEHGR